MPAMSAAETSATNGGAGGAARRRRARLLGERAVGAELQPPARRERRAHRRVAAAEQRGVDPQRERRADVRAVAVGLRDDERAALLADDAHAERRALVDRALDPRHRVLLARRPRAVEVAAHDRVGHAVRVGGEEERNLLGGPGEGPRVVAGEEAAYWANGWESIDLRRVNFERSAAKRKIEREGASRAEIDSPHVDP